MRGPDALAYLAAFADRRRDPSGKKEAVLQTAVQMFIEKGYRQTSLDDVAKKLKITKPALYYYFHNKEANLFRMLPSRHRHDAAEPR